MNESAEASEECSSEKDQEKDEDIARVNAAEDLELETEPVVLRIYHGELFTTTGEEVRGLPKFDLSTKVVR